MCGLNFEHALLLSSPFLQSNSDFKLMLVIKILQFVGVRLIYNRIIGKNRNLPRVRVKKEIALSVNVFDKRECDC